MFIDLDFLNNTGFENLSDFLYSLIDFVISFAVVLAVISVIFSGFKFILSIGDEKKVQEASRSLIFSIVGLILVFISPSIIEFVIREILGIK